MESCLGIDRGNILECASSTNGFILLEVALEVGWEEAPELLCFIAVAVDGRGINTPMEFWVSERLKPML